MATYQTYYLIAPGGYFTLADCPSGEAALDLGEHKFGREAVADWGLALDEPAGAPLATFSWFDDAPEAWLAHSHWPALVSVLTGEECGFADYDLCAALTQRRGDVMAAVLRIASDYIDGALGAAEQAASAGVSGARDAYNAIAEDVPEWLWSEARRWEKAAPGEVPNGGGVVAILEPDA